MSRADLLAAVRATRPLSAEWVAAVTALGAGRRAGFPTPSAAPKPRPGTGRSYYQTIWGITRSHHFSDAERQRYRERAQWEHGSEPLYQEVTRLVQQRQRTESQAKKQAAQAA